MVGTRICRGEGLVLFQSPCVSVLQKESEEYELAYEVLLWDACHCEGDCVGLPAALAAIGPWTETALPLATEYDPERECTTLTVMAYVDMVGPAPSCPAHLIPPQREPDPPPEPDPPDQPARSPWLRRVATVLVLATAFAVLTVTGRQAMTAPPVVSADVLGDAWERSTASYGMTCDTSGLAGVCTDSKGLVWGLTAYLGPLGERRYELYRPDRRVALSVIPDRARYLRRQSDLKGVPGFYALDTPMGPSILHIPGVTPEYEAHLVEVHGARKL